MKNENCFENPHTRQYLPKHLLQDGAKWLLIPCKVMLDGMSLWPERQNVLTKILNSLAVLSYIFCILGNAYFVTRKDVDLGSMAFTLSVLILNIEVSLRMCLVFFCKKKLLIILSKVYNEFWSSDFTGTDLHKELTKKSKFFFAYITGYTFTSAFGVTQFIILPFQERNLPMSTEYPFEWQKSPYYEIMYVWHSFILMGSVFIGCGMDLFFLSLVYNCVAQFKILRAFLETQFDMAIRISTAEARKVLIFCIHRHNKLICVCNEVNQVFSYLILMYYLSNMGSICLSGFTVTFVPEELAKAIALLMGHMSEIFIFCYIGNELIIESTELSNNIFHCGWHLSHTDKDIQKTLIMMMIRSQKPMRISAGGFGFLSLQTFVKLIQFAFSVFTFLSSLLKKQSN